jgi:Ca2+-binding EF-hand superfamily protein
MLDADKDGMLSLSEFRKAIRDHRIEVTDPEIDIVFDYFDREQSGYVDLWGMLFVLRGEMNQFRQKIVETVFQKIDKNQRGIVTISEVKKM